MAIQLQGGTYRLTGPLQPGPQDSGADEGTADVYVDGPKVSAGSGAGSGSERGVLAPVSGPAPGTHPLTVAKQSRSYLLVDGFTLR